MDDDFGFSSSDEAELLALSQASASTVNALKRKAPEEESENVKRVATRQAVSSAKNHSSTLPLAVKILNEQFGLKAFRLKQEAAIVRLLEGGSAVVVFPTGGGKSLCYQVPALAFSEVDKSKNSQRRSGDGVTIVVSPLIALMKDQTDALLRRGIKAACLDSTKSREQALQIYDGLRTGDLKLLYCAPERLNNEGFIGCIKNVRGGVRMVAIDEAHCISEWGHAFRPDYLKVARFVKEIKAERVVCLTATATPRVAQDICDAFDIDSTGLFRTPSYRPNLHLLAEATETNKDKLPKLIKFLRENPGPSIVYVTLQQQSEDVARQLVREKFKAKAFHAGMKPEDKARIQDDFMREKDIIIASTVAFGMGIDKADVRNVVHYDIPRSLEGYSQEIGRAGRDGEVSKCLLFLCGEDMYQKESFARGDLPAKESIHALLKEIFSPANQRLEVGDCLEFRQYNQSKDHDIKQTTLSIIYAVLELQFKLLRAVTPKYSDYSYIEGKGFDNTLRKESSPVAAAIKASASKGSKWTRIDVDSAAITHNVSRIDIVRKLNDWNEQSLIQLKATGVMNVYRILKPLPNTVKEVDELTEKLFLQMVTRETKDLRRTQDVIEMITGRACFALSLSRHFGEDYLPGKKIQCGHCTWCLTQEEVKLLGAPEPVWDNAKFKRILEEVTVRDDPRFLARIAFGISSPRVTQMKLGYSPIFGSMSDVPFKRLLGAFTKACENAPADLNAGFSQPSPKSTKKSAAKPKRSSSSFASTSAAQSSYAGRGRGRG